MDLLSRHAMTWTTSRLPTAADGDIHGMVRWDSRLPGMLTHWSDVRPGEQWRRSAAWQPPAENSGHGKRPGIAAAAR